MPTLFLICGLPGSGKTTLAKRLKRERAALRLTPDEWMAHIARDGNDEVKRAAVEKLQWEIAQRVLSLGVNVILESGFWARNERDDFRARVAARSRRFAIAGRARAREHAGDLAVLRGGGEAGRGF